MTATQHELATPWQPAILPTQRAIESPSPWYGFPLQRAMDSLGVPHTALWRDSLNVAEAWSFGEPTVQAVAERAGVRPGTVRRRMLDLRSLFGVQSRTLVVDRLLQEQYLDYEIQGDPPKLEERAVVALEAILQGEKLDSHAAGRLYSALGSVSNPAAAVRRAYELQLRHPKGLPGARWIGFHVLEGTTAVGTYYPRQPEPGTQRRTWRITQRAISDEMAPDIHTLAPELSADELAILGLVALGCPNDDIGRRLGLPETTVRGRFSKIQQNSSYDSRAGVILGQFEADAFFVTRVTDNKKCEQTPHPSI